MTEILNRPRINTLLYYYDKISGDSYARNTAINRTMEDLVSLTTYYDVIDSCALWIAPDGELSYNTLYTFVSDDYRKQLLDKVIKEHRYSPTYEGNLRNNGEILITLSLSEQDNSVLAVLLDGDHIAKNLALTAFPKVQTKPYAEDDSLLIICSDEDVVPGTVLSGLLEAGKMQDPYYRENEYEARELLAKDYVFETDFCISEEQLNKKHCVLVCEGLDTLAYVYVNEKLVGKADNMHRTWRLPVAGKLKKDENHLEITFRSSLRYIREKGQDPLIHYVAKGCIRGLIFVSMRQRRERRLPMSQQVVF